MATSSMDDAGSACVEEKAMASEDSVSQEINESVLMGESIKLGPFQMETLEGKMKLMLGESAHMTVAPLKVGKAQQSEAWPLLPGLHVLHAYTRLKMGSNKVCGGGTKYV